MGGFCPSEPAQVNVNRARKGLSDVPVTTNGALSTVIGSVMPVGGGSERHVTVTRVRNDGSGRL